jgi:hypothetical protein
MKSLLRWVRNRQWYRHHSATPNGYECIGHDCFDPER